MLKLTHSFIRASLPALIGFTIGLSSAIGYTTGSSNAVRESESESFKLIAESAKDAKNLDLAIETIEAIHAYQAKFNEHQAKQQTPLPPKHFSAEAYIQLYELQRAKLWEDLIKSDNLEAAVKGADTAKADQILFDGIKQLSDLEGQKLLEYTRHLFDNKEPIPVNDAYSDQVNSNIRFFYRTSLSDEKLKQLKDCRDRLSKEYGAYGSMHFFDAYTVKTDICKI